MICVDVLYCLFFRVLGGVATVARTSDGDDIGKSFGVLRIKLCNCDDLTDFATCSAELNRKDGVIFCEVVSMTVVLVWYLGEYEG